MTGKRSPVSITWSEETIRALGVKTDVETAGGIFGMSRTQSYEAVKAGRFPVPVVSVGSRLIVPVTPILRLLDLGTATDQPMEANPAAINPDQLADLVAERVINRLARVLTSVARADPLPGASNTPAPRMLRPDVASGGPEAA